MTEATMRNGLRLNPAEVSAIAATVNGAIRVQDFPVPSRSRHADSKTSSQNRREITDTDDAATTGGREPEKGDHVVVGRVHIAPLEPWWLDIGLPQSRLFTVEMVQVADQRAQPAMRLVFEQMPIEAGVV